MSQLQTVTQSNFTPEQFSVEQVELLKRTICKDATDDELKLFLHVCKRTGLDPFARQIYAVKRQDAYGRPNMVIQTSIDGFRVAAARSGDYAGSDDAILDDEKEPNRATVTVYRMVQGVRCAFTATARWNEYFPGDKLGFMWRKMPCVMLSKVAEALALRKAFPADLSGVYAKEEMDQAQEKGRITVDQPGENDGIQSDEYVVPYGPCASKPISKCDPAILRDFLLEREAAYRRSGRKPGAWFIEFVQHAEPIIADWENGDFKDSGVIAP